MTEVELELYSINGTIDYSRLVAFNKYLSKSSAILRYTTMITEVFDQRPTARNYFITQVANSIRHTVYQLKVLVNDENGYTVDDVVLAAKKASVLSQVGLQCTVNSINITNERQLSYETSIFLR